MDTKYGTLCVRQPYIFVVHRRKHIRKSYINPQIFIANHFIALCAMLVLYTNTTIVFHTLCTYCTPYHFQVRRSERVNKYNNAMCITDSPCNVNNEVYVEMKVAIYRPV